MKKVKSEKFLYFNGNLQYLLTEYLHLGFLVRDYDSFGKFTMHVLLLLYVKRVRRNVERNASFPNTHRINNLEKLTECTKGKVQI